MWILPMTKSAVKKRPTSREVGVSVVGARRQHRYFFLPPKRSLNSATGNDNVLFCAVPITTDFVQCHACRSPNLFCPAFLLVFGCLFSSSIAEYQIMANEVSVKAWFKSKSDLMCCIFRQLLSLLRASFLNSRGKNSKLGKHNIKNRLLCVK